jgi:hypothetical protein
MGHREHLANLSFPQVPYMGRTLQPWRLSPRMEHLVQFNVL